MNLTKMKIRLSQTPQKSNEKYENQHIIVDTEYQKFGNGNLTFKNCTFSFENSGHLILANCGVESCKFEGLYNLHEYKTDRGVLEIIACKKFIGNILLNQFRKIKISNSILEEFIDLSTSTEYEIETSDFRSFSIEGETEKALISETTFNSEKKWNSIWNKLIVKTISCSNIIFGEVKINPYHFATKCADKSTLDISRATLIDDWSRLRKEYSGTRLYIILFLTFIFILPILTHSFFLLTVSKIEPTILFDKIPLWEALIFGGKEGLYSIIYSTLTLILLVYNYGRFHVTMSIAKLREEENYLIQSNFNMVSISPKKYQHLLKWDKYLKILWYLSIALSVLKLWDTITILVPNY